MNLISVLLFIFCLCTGSFGQKITVFENAPFIESAAIQQMKNFAEFEDSYFYTGTSFKTNSLGDNVLVRVNKITGKLESNDQIPIGTNVSWLTATDKYIYYPYFGSKGEIGFYNLKRYDPKTNVHELFKNAKDEAIVFASSFIRQSAFYSYKNKLIVISSYGGITGNYEKLVAVVDDSDTFFKNFDAAKLKDQDLGFYSAASPTENSLAFSNNALYFFNRNSKTFDDNLRKSEVGKIVEFPIKEKESYIPFITANDERAFTLMWNRDEPVTNNFRNVKVFEIVTNELAPAFQVAAVSLDSQSVFSDTQMNVVGDSVYISDRWHLYEYNYKSKKTTLPIKLQMNERFYNIQNGKRFHFAKDGTIFYKKITYANVNETIGNASIFAFDKTKSEAKSLFETALAFNGDDLLKMHEASRNVYFIGNKAVNFKLNRQTDKFDVLIYDKNGTVTNLPMPEIKKFKPSTDWYGKFFTAIQTRDAIVFNYGYQKDKKESRIVVMKLSE